jgi:UDP-GlcNAc:undecaprenyl-phosphate/decaprenyl-phosphate GlcNAc-1-phosphate transferase
MNQIEILLIFFLINIFFVINFDKIKILNLIIDKPDKERKFHKKPTALAGGIILILNITIYYLILSFNKDQIVNEVIFSNFDEFNIFFMTCCLIFFLGFFDDKYNLTPILKFILLTLIIGLFVFLDQNISIKSLNFSFFNLNYNIEKYSFIFTLFCFLVFLNAFNMFDGINLQASSYSMIIFVYFLLTTNNSLFIIILIIFIIFFKYLNYLNKSFLGDNGSLLTSFVIGFIFIKLFNENYILFSDEILILMMIPGIDMIRLFFERIKSKKNPLSYDRMHLHHLLVGKYSYLKSILIINSLILIPIILNNFKIDKLFIITLVIITYSILIYTLRRPKKN